MVAMGLKLMKKLTVAVLLVLLLICAEALLLALTPHDAPVVTDSDGYAITPNRKLLTTRYAPIGFPPPPAMIGPSAPPY